MFLALREVRRSLVRYALLVVAIGLLVFLILFQQALQNGLVTAFVGGIRNQSAPVLVYSVDGQRNLQGSAITPPLEDQIRGAEGVGRAAVIGQSTFTVRVDEADESDAAVLGTDDREMVHVTTLTEGRGPDAPGEAVGSEADFDVGDVVVVVPAADADPVSIRVVGVGRDLQISVSPTLFTDLATFERASLAANPDATAVLPSAIAVAPADGVTPDEVAETINESVEDADALTRADAAEKSPGVAQVRQSFNLILLLYGLVVPLVTGLFFLIVTLQKARSLTLLRAAGARAGVLARSLLLQVALVLAAGVLVGVGLYAPVSQAQVGGLSLRFDVTTVLVWSAIVVVLGLVSALASLRRVLAIDPIEATTGAGVQ